MCDQTFGLGSGSGSGLKVGSGSGSEQVSGSLPHDAVTEAVSLPMGNQGGEMAREMAREDIQEPGEDNKKTSHKKRVQETHAEEKRAIFTPREDSTSREALNPLATEEDGLSRNGEP